MITNWFHNNVVIEASYSTYVSTGLLIGIKIYRESRAMHHQCMWPLDIRGQDIGRNPYLGLVSMDRCCRWDHDIKTTSRCHRYRISLSKASGSANRNTRQFTAPNSKLCTPLSRYWYSGSLHNNPTCTVYDQ